MCINLSERYSTESSISQVYFYGSLSGNFSIEKSSDGVNFTDGASPTNVPGREPLVLTYPALDSLIFSFGAAPPSPNNGINPGIDPEEYLTILFDGNFNSVFNALNNGDLIIGLRVIGIGGGDAPDGGKSDGFLSVPIPATVWIFGAGLLGLVGIRRKLKS